MKKRLHIKLTLIATLYLSNLFLVQGQEKDWNWGAYGDSTFFPISVYLQDVSDIDAYKEVGVNVYSGFWYGLTDNIVSTLNAKNMYYKTRWTKHAPYPSTEIVPDEVAKANIDDPFFIAWLQDDEPDNAKIDSDGDGAVDSCVCPQVIIDHYNEIKAFDNTGRQVFLNCGLGVALPNAYARGLCANNTDMYTEYYKACDIASYDIYPVASAGSPIVKPNDDLWYISDGVKNMRKWTNDSKDAYWFNLECTVIAGKGGGVDADGNDIPRKPTADQMWTEAWMGIVAGATGFSWFPFEVRPLPNNPRALLEDPEMMAAVKRVNSAVHDLAVAINSETLNDAVDVEVQTSLPWELAKIEVDHLVKHVGDTLYILTAGGKGVNPNTATFTINTKDGSTINSNVKVLYEDREIPLVNNTFTHDYTGQEVHLFKIEGISKDILTSIETDKVLIEDKVTLEQNSPNPFANETQITYLLEELETIELSVYNLLGEKIQTLDKGMKQPGRYTVNFNASGLPSGVYVYRLKAGDIVISKKMMH